MKPFIFTERNGIHILDLTQFFLGEVSEVKGYRSNHVWKFDGTEDNAWALLKNTDGKMATVQASWSEWRGYRFWIEIYGTLGCVKASYPPMLAQATWFGLLGIGLKQEAIRRYYNPKALRLLAS